MIEDKKFATGSSGKPGETAAAPFTPDVPSVPIKSGETLGDDDLDNLCDETLADITAGE